MTPLLLLSLTLAQADLAPLRGESPQTRKRLVELERRAHEFVRELGEGTTAEVQAEQ